MREHVFLAAARRAFDMADLEDQRRFDEIIRKLCENPALGASVGTLIDVLPVVVFRYDEGIYRVSYDLPDDATVWIWMIVKGPE